MYELGTEKARGSPVDNIFFKQNKLQKPRYDVHSQGWISGLTSKSMAYTQVFYMTGATHLRNLVQLPLPKRGDVVL